MPEYALSSLYCKHAPINACHKNRISQLLLPPHCQNNKLPQKQNGICRMQKLFFNILKNYHTHIHKYILCNLNKKERASCYGNSLLSLQRIRDSNPGFRRERAACQTTTLNRLLFSNRRCFFDTAKIELIFIPCKFFALFF